MEAAAVRRTFRCAHRCRRDSLLPRGLLPVPGPRSALAWALLRASSLQDRRIDEPEWLSWCAPKKVQVRKTKMENTRVASPRLVRIRSGRRLHERGAFQPSPPPGPKQ